ncbi:substrate-binding domain-containing protein [Testudinibacter aquarius]|uniref:Ribose operon repressor n=1 Tax=Testudinibacter aquarius TaxID=1524974 RepID=A0A4R3Y1F2_9PAST|nr:substrate-binding domain-containing protein [Testudinibacter aquarius]KAE9529943.1 transcriptional regulator [Testudinibacter aquarius]TCV83843.1 LacI family transcriptional regulator [Testudinibacter aquarius]TNG91450.1 LacI family DNA-binding transcriptional regulator [Testudinibacter aquarius]
MATMKDIARLAQVSTSTVSHVINNSRFVSDEIRDKVLAVVRELNYTPSALARSLKIKETKTIGMLVTASANPFFAEVLRSVERYCHRHQYNLILSYTDGDGERLQRNLETLIRKQVDGLILMCAESHWQLNDDISQRLQLPMVMLDWWPTALNADKVHENSEYGGYLATKTLIDAGHRDIAIITGSFKKSLALNRLNGYQTALSQAGIPFRQDRVFESHFDIVSGIESMQQILRLDPRPSAVFACSDTIAIGAYQAVWRAGLQVGKDISIIGYDNIELAQYLSPPLTTIHQSKNNLAKQAVEMLLARIKNPQLPYRTLTLEPHLVWRESVALRGVKGFVVTVS